MLANLSDVLRSPAKGRFSGIGMAMEAFGDNPIVQDLVMDMTWRAEPPPLDAWVKAYVARRYGETTPDVEAAWAGLLETVYRSPEQTGSLLARRPDSTIRSARTVAVPRSLTTPPRSPTRGRRSSPRATGSARSPPTTTTS